MTRIEGERCTHTHLRSSHSPRSSSLFRYGRELFRHLKVYKGAAHPHEAQVKRCRRSPPLPAAPASHVSPRFPPSQTPEALTFTGLTSEPDSRVLDLQDPDAMFCATD